MKKIISLLLVLCLMLPLAGAWAEEPAAEAAPVAAEEEPAVSYHTIELNGELMSYTATAGRMPVKLGDATGKIFYVAYTLNGVDDLSERPVTFAFNGGPGSSSEWLHLGMLGPKRVDVDGDGQPRSLPTKLVDNPYTLLDLTDLVFIDPIGTGYSRVDEGVDPAPFYTYEGDIASVSEFIRLYVTRNGRWGSQKYVAGESYGTIRAAGVVEYLANAYSMGLNGAMLVSSINDFGSSPESVRNDLGYVLALPTYAAIGHYHGLLGEKYQSMTVEQLMDEAAAFAGGEYQEALFRGAELTGAEKDAVAGRIAELTGLQKDFVLSMNLRISVADFCPNLLKDKNLMVGRIDGRYTGPITAGDIGSSNADPSYAILDAAFGGAINRYLADELDYHTDLNYETLSNAVNASWVYGLDNRVLDQKEDIYSAMSQNPYLKWWVLGGYYDLATPFCAARWVYDHIFLNDDTRQNLTFTLYPSGHMIYMHEPSLARFRREAETWYRGE